MVTMAIYRITPCLSPDARRSPSALTRTRLTPAVAEADDADDDDAVACSGSPPPLPDGYAMPPHSIAAGLASEPACETSHSETRNRS